MKITKNDDKQPVTNEALQKGIDNLAILINKSFVGMESHMAKQEDLLALASRVEYLGSRRDKFERNVDGRFDKIFLELKEIRSDMKKVDTRGEILNLENRVATLEKKLSA